MMRVSNEMDELSRNSEHFLVNNANLFPDASLVFLSLAFLSVSFFFHLLDRQSWTSIREVE